MYIGISCVYTVRVIDLVYLKFVRNINYKWSWKIKTGSEDLWNFLITLSGTTKIFCAPYLNSQLVNETKPIHDYSRKVAGLIQLKWEEDPIVWISPHKMGVLRTFYAGPWEKMKLILSIEHKSHGESYLNVDISIGTISIYGFLLVKIYVGYFQ